MGEIAPPALPRRNEIHSNDRRLTRPYRRAAGIRPSQHIVILPWAKAAESVEGTLGTRGNTFTAENFLLPLSAATAHAKASRIAVKPPNVRPGWRLKVFRALLLDTGETDGPPPQWRRPHRRDYCLSRAGCARSMHLLAGAGSSQYRPFSGRLTRAATAILRDDPPSPLWRPMPAYRAADHPSGCNRRQTFALASRCW